MTRLLRLLRSGSPRERVAAASQLRGLIRLTRPEMLGGSVVTDLIPALDDEDDDVREQVAVCFEEMGPAAKAVIPALVKGIEGHKRFYFAEALVGVGAASLTALRKLADEADPEVAAIGRWGLGHPKFSQPQSTTAP